MAKQSRRVRQQIIKKQRKRGVETPLPLTEDFPPAATLEAETSLSEPPANRRDFNFAQEYFYIYNELRTMFIVTALLIVVLIGLSFVI